MAAIGTPNRMANPHDPSVATGDPSAPVRDKNNRWALWGVGAALLGAVATLLPGKVNPQVSNDRLTAAVIDSLHRWTYHVAVVAGFGAVLCLLLCAAGWRRWAADRTPNSMAANVIPSALGASAAAMMIGYGLLGSLAVYLPGGIDQHAFAHSSLLPIYMVVDFAPFVAWWGIAIAAAAVTLASLREHLFARWIGIFSAIVVALAVIPMVVTGLPGMPGVVGPLWLLIVSMAQAISRDSRPSLRRAA